MYAFDLQRFFSKIHCGQILFDKLIYQKLSSYGYWQKDKGLEQFGPRTIGVQELNNWQSKNYPNEPSFDFLTKDSVLGKNSQELTIVLIGDSYFFGQGLKYEDSVASVLEKKLKSKFSEISIEVINLLVPRDNIFDYYHKYLWAKHIWNQDLTAIATRYNDLL